MGGSLAWTIRLSDGTEHRTNQWTNPMPPLIQNPDFLAGEQDAIDAALADWLAMKSDWETNHETEDFEYRATRVFGPYPFGLRPSEYGLVVTDFVSKTILSLQGYSHLDKLLALRLSSGPDAMDISPTRAEQITQAAQDGRVKSYEFVVRRADAAEAMKSIGATVEPHLYDPKSLVVSVPGSVDLDDLTELCDSIRENVPAHPHAPDVAAARVQLTQMPPEDPERARLEAVLHYMESSHRSDSNPFFFAHANLDLAPFTLEVFSEGSEGYEALLARVQELGFQLSDEELTAWNQRICEIREEEQEEA